MLLVALQPWERGILTSFLTAWEKFPGEVESQPPGFENPHFGDVFFLDPSRHAADSYHLLCLTDPYLDQTVLGDRSSKALFWSCSWATFFLANGILCSLKHSLTLVFQIPCEKGSKHRMRRPLGGPFTPPQKVFGGFWKVTMGKNSQLSEYRMNP